VNQLNAELLQWELVSVSSVSLC